MTKSGHKSSEFELDSICRLLNHIYLLERPEDILIMRGTTIKDSGEKIISTESGGKDIDIKINRGHQEIAEVDGIILVWDELYNGFDQVNVSIKDRKFSELGCDDVNSAKMIGYDSCDPRNIEKMDYFMKKPENRRILKNYRGDFRFFENTSPYKYLVENDAITGNKENYLVVNKIKKNTGISRHIEKDLNANNISILCSKDFEKTERYRQIDDETYQKLNILEDMTLPDDNDLIMNKMYDIMKKNGLVKRYHKNIAVKYGVIEDHSSLELPPYLRTYP